MTKRARADLVNRAMRGYVIRRYDKNSDVPLLVTMSEFRRAVNGATDKELAKLVKDNDL